MADPYATLGVARGATEADIKKAYRKLAKELHPDRNKDNKAASDRFTKVTQAYDLLTDKDKRARFDRGEIDGDGNPTSPFGFGTGGGGAGGFRPGPGGRGGFDMGPEGQGGDFSDIFEGLFGGRAGGAGGGFASGFGRRAQPKGGNVAYRLKVPFEDAATLSPQRITLADGKTIDLKLPAGVDTGTQMRLSGKGDPGPGGAGDAIVTVEVQPHRFYTRDGDDVRVDLPINLAEAVLGGKVRVPTVDGAVMLSVPKGATSGKTLRLKGRGFHRKDGTRGDQLVTLMVDLPADDADLTRFVEGWSGANTDPRAKLGV
ncbi:MULTISPECIES: DnaJ C-terminal domain-containing protein [Sphingomonas]|jgi:DnaJ-class molecular chaperone|uniref:DnaJ C-terminal domain-containing protein n=1 Tax=Sphingomonas TaxID=13687 RepID=UPI000DBBDF7C|nr:MULTISPECIES: DnaJ C-terminal domain-containing protein [Sphingomonas]PZT91296.1 MAG: molecular chaperone DnaJ [Sphingomonas sp.]RSV21432.1 J domain-containing protein [Sphingomonas sp. ABOLH]WCP73234.1 DnaJ C-terminal domain-containing protein [Sphingomonas hankookensis]